MLGSECDYRQRKNLRYLNITQREQRAISEPQIDFKPRKKVVLGPVKEEIRASDSKLLKLFAPPKLWEERRVTPAIKEENLQELVKETRKFIFRSSLIAPRSASIAKGGLIPSQ